MNETISFLSDNIDKLYILILSVFVGVEVIGKVPSVLHTPLMSGANAAEPDNILLLSLGFLAVILGTLNVVGGFVVTDRMLEMFGKKKEKK
jgi:H+-translocating NAD(P) transhydrogenase subunit alpha